MKKEFLLMSGGLDSTTLAYILKKEKNINFDGLFVDYGQPTAAEEFRIVQEVGNNLEVRARRVDLSTIWENFISEGLDPLAAACTETNNIFAPLLLAATFAYADNGVRLYSAFHKNDLDSFPATLTVLKAQESIMNSVAQHKDAIFEYSLPFIDKQKKDIITIGKSLEVPFEMTLTCLNTKKSEKGNCGVCKPCNSRRKAFLDSGIVDKTIYMN